MKYTEETVLEAEAVASLEPVSEAVLESLSADAQIEALLFRAFLSNPSEAEQALHQVLNIDENNELAQQGQTWLRGIRELAEHVRFENELEKERLEQERLEQERLEQERLEQERLEQERLEQERLEQERLEQERLEQERLEQERLEQERLEQERLEQERLEQERLEQERLEQERLEQERLEQERLEQERLEQERLEQERLEQERLEQERLEQERLEQERLEQERLEQERAEQERAEQERQEEEAKAAEQEENVEAQQEIQDETPAEQEQFTGSDKPVVLSVDDSPTIRKLVSMTLSLNGYEVVTAEDGVAALNLLSEIKPDLIVSDINMPRLDGYKLCKFVKKHKDTRHIPVLLLSGKDGVFDQMRGRMSGCNGYLTKPFESTELLAQVQKYLGTKV